ncbi:hypothetical protein DL771_006447 [Monosporascus sp. 5C6A]|nr:hypothetical protein DL771_006447 [Monosporascus sp. 5C6A]
MEDILSAAVSASGILDSLHVTLGLLRVVKDINPRSYVVLNFRTVQRGRIDGLQREILDKVDSIKDTMNGPEPVTESDNVLRYMNHELDQLLHVYANALRDYETFSQEPIANPEDEVKTKLESLLPVTLLPVAQALQTFVQGIVGPGERHPVDCNFRELNREIRLEKEREKAFLHRLVMGSFGGLALIIPMLIMALLPGLKTSLITSSVATVLFASLIARYEDNAAGKDILAAVAAYAAVLVVFVGASMAPAQSII